MNLIRKVSRVLISLAAYKYHVLVTVPSPSSSIQILLRRLKNPGARLRRRRRSMGRRNLLSTDKTRSSSYLQACQKNPAKEPRYNSYFYHILETFSNRLYQTHVQNMKRHDGTKKSVEDEENCSDFF